jgi:hypothetical protein
MEDTTTSGDNGAAVAAQPDTNTEAVTLGEKGAPILRSKVAPTSTPQSQNDIQEEAPAPGPEPVEQEQTTQTAADDDTSDIQAWAKKKGIDLEDADPVKLAQMIRESEKRMHEATAQAKQLEGTIQEQPLLEYTGNEAIDQLALQVNQLTIQNRVTDFFRANPDAREYETKMAEIVQQRPHLQNDLDALFALAVNSPNRAAELKQEGGRDALTNLAQKQSAIPPTSNASTGVSSSREKITPDNVDQVVAAHMGDTKWYNAHKAEVNRAMAGNR